MANRTLRIVLGDRPIAYHPILAHVFESAGAALFLSQLLYWDSTLQDTRHEKRDGWIYKTGKEWLEETGLCRKEQEDAREKLKASGVIEEKRAGVPCRLWYRVRFDELERLIELYLDHSAETSSSVCDQSTIQFATSAQTGLEPVHKLDCDQSANKHDTSPQTITETTIDNTSSKNTREKVSIFWQDVLREVEPQLAETAYRAYLARTEAVGRENGTFTIRAQNAACKNVIENRLRKPVERVLRRLSGQPELTLIVEA